MINLLSKIHFEEDWGTQKGSGLMTNGWNISWTLKIMCKID